MEAQTTSPSHSWKFWHPRADIGLYVGGLILALVLGAAGANGWATYNALHGQAAYFQRDCHGKLVKTHNDAFRKGVAEGWTDAVSTPY